MFKSNTFLFLEIPIQLLEDLSDSNVIYIYMLKNSNIPCKDDKFLSSFCLSQMQISRLIYNNAGNSILALTSNATHLYWKWPQNDFDLSDTVSKTRDSNHFYFAFEIILLNLVLTAVNNAIAMKS